MESIDPGQESVDKLERTLTDRENTLSGVKGIPPIPAKASYCMCSCNREPGRYTAASSQQPVQPVLL